MRPCSITRVRLRPETRAHEEFLNITQAAELSVKQVFTVAATEQTPRDRNFALMNRLLIEFAAPDFQNYLRLHDLHSGNHGRAVHRFVDRALGSNAFCGRRLSNFAFDHVHRDCPLGRRTFLQRQL